MNSASPRRYAFHFDSSACAGCKACQIACKDKHGLEVGRLWRRVYDVTGGEWKRDGKAWKPDVFAFHLSIACNHCARPICVEVCPSRALRQREDGIVTLDTERCLGCRYCEWACPYGAPQYDRARGHMTKCTFCADELDEGREPVCVTACPLRVLELGVREANAALVEVSERQDPLPDPQLTAPALLMEEHRDAKRAREEAVEVIPRQRYELHEWSLVVFTLLTQLAAGVVLWSPFFVGKVIHGHRAPMLFDPTWTFVTMVMLIALVTSLRHLGSPRRASRALANLGRSWLSREIFAALLFLVVCVATLFVTLRNGASELQVHSLRHFAIYPALVLILAVAQVYRLRTVSTWDTVWTPLSFLTTSMLLGILALIVGHLITGELDHYHGPLIVCSMILVAARRSVVWMRNRRLAALAGPLPREARPTVVGPILALLAFLLLTGALLAEDAPLQTLPLLPAIVLLLITEVLDRHRFFKSYVRCGI